LYRAAIKISGILLDRTRSLTENHYQLLGVVSKSGFAEGDVERGMMIGMVKC
jgi:hypothetical protein